MDPNLQVVTALLRSLSNIAADPALGYRGSAILSILNLAALTLEKGTQGMEELKALAAKIDLMVAEGREPTKVEWGDLKARSDAAHVLINSLDNIEDPDNAAP